MSAYTHTSLDMLSSPTDEGFASMATQVESSWYAVYTCAHHEKKIAEQITRRSIEHFLPLYQTVRRWKDRRVSIQVPLFPSYIFVCIALSDQAKVLQVPGVVRFVSFSGRPVALPEVEM